MSDFAAGASVGFGIQQRILAKKLREIDDARYKDETAESRRRFDAEVAARNRGLGINETGQQISADQFDRSLAQERELREKELAARIRELDAGNGIRNKDIAARSRAEQIDQYLRLMDIAGRASKGSNTGLRGGAGGYGYDEYGPDGELVKRRVPVGMGGGQPQAEATDPRAQELANAIAGLQTAVGKHQVEMAGGDMRTGFLGMGGSRQSQIDEANAKIAKLRAMQGGALAQPGAQTSAIDAEMQRRGFVKNPDGKWIKLTAQ